MSDQNDIGYDLGPFHEQLGIQVEGIDDGQVTLSLELAQRHSSTHEELVAQGGVVFSLADVAGAFALMSVNDHVTPTIDMRIDYLAPATGNLLAEATVLRNGSQVGTADVEVEETGGPTVASARGVYKTGGYDSESPWDDAIARR